jgi:hypothetical protein
MKNSNSHLPVAALCATLLFCGWIVAQDKSPSPSPSTPASSCSRDLALTLIQQQIDATKTFDEEVRRITVLIKAADLIWPYQQTKARSAFADAFETAQRDFKEKGDKPKQEGHLIIQVADQRFVVISAIAKHDAVWARKLTEQLSKEDAETAKQESSQDPGQDARTGEKLLSLAYELMASNEPAALSISRTSLRYPATFWLSLFLYKLSEQNSAAAENFYREALAVYANGPLDRFLYLALYPFGESCDLGDPPLTTCYTVPNRFAPNVTLQRLFIQTLLGRSQQVIEGSVESGARDRSSDARQIWLALTRLDRVVEKFLPELIEPLRQAKAADFAILNQQEQQSVTLTVTEQPPKSFDEQVEDAERQPDAARRDGFLVFAVLGAASKENLERLIDVIAKINDELARKQLLDWLYFERAQKEIKDEKLDRARALAAKVTQLDQRAYLYLKIAEAFIKTTKNDASARESLDEVLEAAAKAPDTIVKARALLGVAYLYSSIEPSRGISVLSDAVRCINHLESPDFSNDDAGRRIEGKKFGAYAMMQTPGFSAENGFREISKVDFDGTLNQAVNLSEKSLRAMTTLAVVEQCLKDRAVSPKTKQSNTPAKPK